MPGFQIVLRLKCGRFTRFDHQVRHESKTLQKYSFYSFNGIICTTISFTQNYAQ